MNKINMIQEIAIEQLYPHPDNRPLGINEEKVEQLAEMMKANGYDQSKPLKARPNGKPDAYQIIEGEHRWRRPRYSAFKDITVTALNNDTGVAVEFYEGKMQYFLYGYYDETKDAFGDVVFVNFIKLQYYHYINNLEYEDGLNKKNQTFFTFKFEDLIRRQCVDWTNIDHGIKPEMIKIKMPTADYWRRLYLSEKAKAKTA